MARELHFHSTRRFHPASALRAVILMIALLLLSSAAAQVVVSG